VQNFTLVAANLLAARDLGRLVLAWILFDRGTMPDFNGVESPKWLSFSEH